MILRATTPLVPVFLVAVAMFAAVTVFGSARVTYFQVSSIASSMAPLALAAMGETIVILARGFDLSAGAAMSLSNVIFASQVGTSLTSQMIWTVLAVGSAAVVGVINGYFVAYRRLQPIVVTLATMFMVAGIDLLILPAPGGTVPSEFSSFFGGDAIESVLPAPFLHIFFALVLWWVIRGSRLGTAIYAVGGNEEAARAQGVRTARTTFLSYVLGGFFYGYAGLLMSANTASGDPLGGSALLLPIFAAVVIGGTRLGGGRGGCLGTVFAAFILMQIASLMLVLKIETKVAPLFEGCIILASIAMACFRSGSPLPVLITRLRKRLRGRARVITAPQTSPLDILTGRAGAPRADNEAGIAAGTRFLTRHRDVLVLIGPVFLLLIVALIMSGALLGQSVLSMNYVNSVLILTLILAVLALGQGLVVISGGMDLSMGQAATLCAVLTTSLFAKLASFPGSTGAISMVVLAVGALIGLGNGIGVVCLGIPAVIMTIGSNGILAGLTLLYTDGIPAGAAPPALRWLFVPDTAGVAPASVLLGLLALGGWLLLARSRLGWRLYAVGSNRTVAALSGISVNRTSILAFVLSGLCSAAAGMLLVGYGGSAVLNMGESYVLPALAAVFVGGTLATGGRGHYVGMLGGAMLLTTLGTLATGMNMTPAIRQIIFGAVVLAAVLWLEESEAR